METNNQKGWLQFQNDETYIAFQKKMYAQSRSQLETTPRISKEAGTGFVSLSRNTLHRVICGYSVCMKKVRYL